LLTAEARPIRLAYRASCRGLHGRGLRLEEDTDQAQKDTGCDVDYAASPRGRAALPLVSQVGNASVFTLLGVCNHSFWVFGRATGGWASAALT
jgi:hypothetical protein